MKSLFAFPTVKRVKSSNGMVNVPYFETLLNFLIQISDNASIIFACVAVIVGTDSQYRAAKEGKQ